jgi:pimeloyl-ACP methyl ester carboxylesterase
MNTSSTPTRVEHHHVDIDGLSTFYRAAGDPAHPAIVLLHGFPSSSHMFRELIPLLAERFRVIAPDYIGFGHSAAPTVEQFDYSFDSLAAHVRALLDRIGVTEAIYYMHDYGGPIGLRLATARPALVRGLVVQNANAYVDGLTPAVAGVFMPLWEKGDESGARQMLLAETTRMQYTAGARDAAALNPDAWVMDQALLDRHGSAERQMALFNDYRNNVPLYEVWQAYFRTHQPKTLVAWGRGDPFFGVPGAEAFRRDLKDVRVELLDSGHFALEEDAARVAKLIEQTFGAGSRLA